MSSVLRALTGKGGKMSESRNKAPRRAGRGASQESACDRNHSDCGEGNSDLSRDQVANRLKSNIPAELQEYAQWVVWKQMAKPGAKKPTKIPFNARTGKAASTKDPESWSSFDNAVEAFRVGDYNGVGFVFTEADPYVGIDFDHVLLADGWDPEVIEHIYSICGYTETSPSGDGAHVIARASVGLNRNRRNFGERSGFEIYTEGRYFTVTGNTWTDVRAVTIRDATDAVEACVTRYLGAAATSGDQSPLPTREGQARLGESQGDDTGSARNERTPGTESKVSAERVERVLTRARRARNGGKFSKLFDEGDASDYGGDQSAADFALCGMLAFWTGGKPSEIDHLFRLSKLMRPKWDTPRGNQTYGQITIARALPDHSTASRGKAGAPESATSSGSGSDPSPDDEGNGEAPVAASFKCTDFGNSERFTRDHWRDVRYVHPWGQWLVWDGKRWKKDGTGEIVRLAKRTVRKIYAEAAAASDDDTRASLAAWAKRSEAKERVKALIDFARAEQAIAITHEVLDADPYLFNCSNGTLCLRTGHLREHRREDLITKLSPVEFQADSPCPKWHRFLDQIMGEDVEMIKFLKRFSGYSLTGETSEQCLASLYGFGANGKSTYIECLAEIWGDYFQRAPTSLILKRPDGSDGIPNDVARLPGARLVVTSEVEDGSRMAESRIKDLTGGDRLIARFLRQEFFEFDPTHKLWIVGNHRVFIAGTDHGIWRRIMQIPFEITIPEKDRDPKLKERLIAEELPGILAWCVEGCLEWQEGGLTPPSKVTEATEEYRAEMDTVGQFLDERCLLVQDATVTKAALYEDYRDWSAAGGMLALSMNRFGRRMKEKSFCDDRSAGRRVWIGLTLQAD